MEIHHKLLHFDINQLESWSVITALLCMRRQSVINKRKEINKYRRLTAALPRILNEMALSWNTSLSILVNGVNNTHNTHSRFTDFSISKEGKWMLCFIQVWLTDERTNIFIYIIWIMYNRVIRVASCFTIASYYTYGDTLISFMLKNII